MNECAREITWAGGKHVFNLNDKHVRLRMQVIGLPGVFGNTPAACLRRLQEDAYSTDDLERIIEWGLIGGGMSPREAEALLDAHVRMNPVAPNAMLAAVILGAFFTGEVNADASA